MINFDRMRHLIKVLPDLAFECKNDIDTLRSPNMDGMPHGNATHSNVQDAAIMHELVMQAYRESVYELNNMRAELVTVVPMLKNQIQRGMIRMRYLNGYSVAVIASVHHYSNRHVQRLLQDAEIEVNKLLGAE